MKLSLTIIVTLYPLLVYTTLRHGSTYVVIILLGLVIGVRAYMSLREHMSRSAALTLASSAALVAAVSGSLVEYIPLLLPTLTNLFLLSFFSLSLVYPPSIIERIAVRMKGPLPPEGVRHCRTVCQVWIAFFTLNSIVSLDSVFRSLEWWSLYNGLISYCIAGTIFVTEYLVRQRIMKRFALRGSLAVLLCGTIVALGCPRAFAQPLTIQLLEKKLSPPGPFRTQFSEKRFIAVLSAPLESRGELRCLPQLGLVWETTAPVRRTSLITPRGIRHIKEGRQGDLTVDHAGVSEALLSLMSGDIARAEGNFEIETGGIPQEWRIVLTPRDSLVADVIRTISVFGRDRPDRIEIAHANGDRVVTSFTAPIALLPDEIVQAREALGSSDE